MKRFISFTTLLCALFVAMTSFSANAQSGIVGKWKQVIEQAGVKTVVTYDFRTNGTVFQTMVMKGESPAIDIVGTAEFKYKYANGVITFKFSGDDVNFSKFKMEGFSDETISMMMEQMKSSMVNVEQKLTNVRITGDRLTAKSQGVDISMTRISGRRAAPGAIKSSR